MSDIQPFTGTTNELYDLVSILYHTLQACETIDKYCRDAQLAQDPEVLQFFRQTMADQRRIAEQCKTLLAPRLARTHLGAPQPAR